MQYVLRESPLSPVSASCCTALVDAYSMCRLDNFHMVKKLLFSYFTWTFLIEFVKKNFPLFTEYHNKIFCMHYALIYRGILFEIEIMCAKISMNLEKCFP